MTAPTERASALSTEEIRERYPSTRILSSEHSSKQAWNVAFRARPDAMHALLADYIKQVYARPGRTGQRPMPAEEQVDFDALVFGYENDDPLPVALRKLMKGSERQFLERTHMTSEFAISRSQFRRIMSGESEATVPEIRLIAAAVGKPPVFFIEYRKAMALAAFKDLIDQRPGIATSLYRKYIEVRAGDK